MANLYTYSLLRQGPDSTRCEFSLCSLLTTSNEVFMVDGVRILQEGSSGRNKYLADLRKRLERSGTENVEEKVSRYAFDNEYIIDDEVPFYAMHYTFHPTPHEDIEKRLIYNRDGGVIGEIDVARKQIDFFRLAARPVDEAKKARFRKGYYYDGTLRDALGEFEQEGFTFNLLDTAWYPHNIVNGEKTRDISHVIPVERVSIDKLVSLRSRI